MADTVVAGPSRSARAWKSVRAALGRGVRHEEVLAHVAEGGRSGNGYLMMIAISAAIAILGLLLSSPAVVIGAMLLSPLMGPIILLGFAFWTVDWEATRRAAFSLAAGLGLALVVSILLVLLSPLKEPTAEILARSRPTLFDLMVAIFSGIAGGYAVVRQKGEAVIGVAIATALMPPLATIGFGVGTGAWAIAGGAALLFFTNLVAIALAAAGVAAVSGFTPHAEGGGRRAWVRHAAVVVVVVALCVPLTLSLQTIALESRATARARSDVARLFGPKARVASLTVRDDHHLVRIDGLVATPKYVSGALTEMERDLRAQLHTPVRIVLDQVVLADPSRLKPTAAPPPGAPATRDPDADLRQSVPFADAQVMTDAASGAHVVRLDAASGLDLAGARALEDGLRRRATDAEVQVSPPVTPLAPVLLTLGTGDEAPSVGDLGLQRWALMRWRAPSVRVGVCRARGRPRDRDLLSAVEAALAPLPVSMTAAPRATCAAAGAKTPFLLVAPGAQPPPAANTAPPAATQHAATRAPAAAAP